MKFDDLITEVSEFGPYQKWIYALICLEPVIVGMQIMVGVFTQATPDHRCAVPGLENDTWASQGEWHDILVNATIPRDSKDNNYGQCKMFRMRGGSDTMGCGRYVYNREPFHSTIVTDIDLVCDKKLMATYTSMIMMGGMFLGSLVLGVVADILGRRKVLILSSFGMFSSSLCIAWARSYILYTALKFVVSFFCAGMILSTFVLALELVGPAKRRLTGNIMTNFWPLGLYIQAVVAYFIRDWRTLQIAITIPIGVVFVLYAFFMTESPRWLIQRGRNEEAVEIIEKIAKWNNYDLSENDNKTLQNIEVHEENQSVWKAFTYPTLVFRCLILFFNWMVASMAYYGLSLNAGSLSGNVYVNFALMALAENLAFSFVLFMLDTTGRKLLHVTAMCIGGVACIATMFPAMYGDGALDWLIVVLSLIGKFGVSVGFAVVFMLAAELFPTGMRNSIVGICSVFARLGGVLAPFIGNLDKQVSGDIGVALPMVIFGILSVTAGLLAIILPETSKKSTP